jgi:hypothetical protein
MLSIVLPQLTHLKKLDIMTYAIACDRKTFDPDMVRDYRAFLNESNIDLNEKSCVFKFDIFQNDNDDAYK